MRAAVGGGAGAREGRLECGWLIDADRRDRLDFRRAGNAGFGARGGPKAPACCRVVRRCRPDRRGPLPPPVVRVGHVRFLLILLDCGEEYSRDRMCGFDCKVYFE